VGDSKEERGDNASKSEDKALQSAASLDLIARNADFISLE